MDDVLDSRYGARGRDAATTDRQLAVWILVFKSLEPLVGLLLDLNAASLVDCDVRALGVIHGCVVGVDDDSVTLLVHLIQGTSLHK